MNLETKIIIYKFTPQVFTLTRSPLVWHWRVFSIMKQTVSLN